MKGVSIIIPTYNREHFIAQAVQSVLDQQFAGVKEIIVSDDGSTDGTRAIVEAFGEMVVFLAKPEDCTTQGASGARNRGIRAATQPYICFLDSDDFFLPGHLQKMASLLESASKPGFAFCRVLEMKEYAQEQMFRPWTKPDIGARDIQHLNVSKHNVVQTNGFIFKKEVFETVGYFDEALQHAEDIDLWMRISERYQGKFSNHYGAVIRRGHGFGQLTDKPKTLLLKTHVDIFSRALRRYSVQRQKDRYRLLKLIYITSKYKALQLPMIYQLDSWLQRIRTSRTKGSENWQTLSNFI